MSYVEHESLTITATSSGSIATTSAKVYNGLLSMIRYVASATTSSVIGNTGSVIAITAENSGLTLISLAVPSTSATWPVRTAVVDTAGVSTGVNGMLPLVNEHFIVTIT